METKNCSACKKELPVDNFVWANKKLGRRNSRCKACGNKYYLKNGGKGRKRSQPVPEEHKDNYAQYWWNRSKDGLQHVYILPEIPYAGITDNPEKRRSKHKTDGKNTNGFRVIFSHPSRDVASELEEFLHDLGYEGRHALNSYK